MKTDANKTGIEPEPRSGSLDAVVGAHDLHGGKWLGAAREWLQWNTLNGDSVTWGSSDVLRPSMTVKMVEEMAAHIAAAAINEERERVRSNDGTQRPRN